MRNRTIALALLGTLVFTGGVWFARLDKETKGLLAALPIDRRVLSWRQDQRDAAFRAMDRLTLLASASQIAPSPTPLTLPSGDSLEIPEIDEYLAKDHRRRAGARHRLGAGTAVARRGGDARHAGADVARHRRRRLS